MTTKIQHYNNKHPTLTTTINLIICITILATINITAHFTALSSYIITVPTGVAILLAIAKINGIQLKEIGISKNTLKKGIKYGTIGLIATATIIIIGMLIPNTREMFMNNNYNNIYQALIAAFIIIPIATVIPEEIAFRGVLHGILQRFNNIKFLFIGSSLLFGIWHIASSLNFTEKSAILISTLGSGTTAQWIGVIIPVTATTIAGLIFTWLRQKTNSIIAPIFIHWALNAFGAVASATAWIIL